MNKLDQQYTDLLKTILEYGVDKKDRTGTGTKSIFGYTIRHNMKDGFPLLTTKKMPFKTIVTELLWFLRGDTNIKYLVDNDCHIWNGDAYKNYSSNVQPWEPHLDMNQFVERIKNNDEFAKKWGELGPIYGSQWRKWSFMDDSSGYRENWEWDSIDQIQNLINNLKTNPDSRRLMVNAWNVGELDQMVLPPCHYGFQVYTRELTKEEKLEYVRKYVTPVSNDSELVLISASIPTRAISLMWNQRSVDAFLGLPFNIASYGLLLEMLAKEVNMVPDQLIGNLGDVHLYSNHIEQAKEQIGRELTLEERLDLADSFNPSIRKDCLNKTHAENETEELKLMYRSEWLDGLGVVPKRTREPFPLPIVKLSSGHNLRAAIKGNFEEIDPNDIMLINYESHPTIKAPLSN
jgi:thymidylate synthase